RAGPGGGSSDVQWCFSQVKGAMDDDVAEGKYIWALLSLNMLLVLNDSSGFSSTLAL
uniref:Uncharacterized protein n=1 Tax=Poecilia reticulata TaxID=8081 RepID=A0A3P9NSK3_POERE